MASSTRPLVKEFINKWNPSGALVNDVSRLELGGRPLVFIEFLWVV